MLVYDKYHLKLQKESSNLAITVILLFFGSSVWSVALEGVGSGSIQQEHVGGAPPSRYVQAPTAEAPRSRGRRCVTYPGLQCRQLIVTAAI